jgi:HEPN domain-containing protein
LAAQWIEKAGHDLVTARAVLTLPDGPTDTPCFHAQQAVEKALKALLTKHGKRFAKVHDLLVHFDAAVVLLPDLCPFRERIADLAGYAVTVRYPGDSPDPSRRDAQSAVRAAEEVVRMVADAVHPKKKVPSKRRKT